MIILDTDHISLLQRPTSQEAKCLEQRLSVSVDRNISTTVATVEEQMRGWLQVIARYRDPMQQIGYYDKLIEFIRFFSNWTIVPLEASAVNVFQNLQTAKIRVSTTDMKIASISLDRGALLLTRNARDFQRVPGLRFDDWTKPDR